MKLLRRKIDNYLKEWKSDKERMPLIVNLLYLHLEK